MMMEIEVSDEFDPMQDDFDQATDEFITPADLINRLQLVIPLRRKTMKNMSGEEYVAIFADLVVLTGERTDLIPQVPGVYTNVMVSSTRCVGQLEDRLPRGDQPGRMLLGRLNGRPSQRNRNVTAYGYGKPDQDGDIILGRKGVAMYRAYMDAPKDEDPFA